MLFRNKHNSEVHLTSECQTNEGPLQLLLALALIELPALTEIDISWANCANPYLSGGTIGHSAMQQSRYAATSDEYAAMHCEPFGRSAPVCGFH